ncbi:MAG: signal peptide peptidase SppA [Spirochaetes bacterium]|nr:signal peptide peptidase SppA [Spirochaetota bacterium]
MKKILSIILLLSATGCISISTARGLQPYRENIIRNGAESKILVIHIDGVISDSISNGNPFNSSEKIPLTARIKEQLDCAEKDKNIKALILMIDSPGGEVTTCDIIHHEIIQFKKRTSIPVTVLMGSMAASGGYYLAMTGDKVMAHPTTITGSIGVLISKLSMKQLMGKIGIEDETVKSGANKTMGSFFKNMTEEEKQLFQEIVDAMYEGFLKVILDSRKDLKEQELRKVADGRIFIAKDALKYGLIDGIGYFNDAVASAEKSAGIENAKIITYVRPDSYRPNVYAGASVTNEGTINVLSIDMDLFSSKFGTRFMYLWKD